jgi:hypothetical protein
VKQLFFSAPPAEANARSVESVRIDVSQMQQNIKNLPEQKMNDSIAPASTALRDASAG